MNEEQIKEMCSDIYTGGDWEPMIDYITNLQKENERLTRFKYNIPNDKTTSVPTITKSYKKEYENYKSRCEKAIEYIDNKVLSNGEVIDQLRIIEVEELLNILNGGDE